MIKLQLGYEQRRLSMAYVDKTINCVDCSATFTFSAGEQEFFAGKGFTNEPKRCPDCRQAKKQQHRGSHVGLNSYS